MTQEFPHINRVHFYVEAKYQKAASEKEQRPVYRDVEMIELRFAGETKRVHHAPAHEPVQMTDKFGGHMTYAKMFHREYEAFKAGREQLQQGTPLSVLPGLPPSRVKSLEARNISTVEALAALNATARKGLGMDGADLVSQAKRFLEAADSAVSVRQMQEENAALQRQIDEMRAMIQAGAAAEPAETPADKFDAMERDELVAHLEKHGIKPRANASMDSLKTAAREIDAQMSEGVAA